MSSHVFHRLLAVSLVVGLAVPAWALVEEVHEPNLWSNGVGNGGRYSNNSNDYTDVYIKIPPAMGGKTVTCKVDLTVETGSCVLGLWDAGATDYESSHKTGQNLLHQSASYSHAFHGVASFSAACPTGDIRLDVRLDPDTVVSIPWMRVATDRASTTIPHLASLSLGDGRVCLSGRGR